MSRRTKGEGSIKQKKDGRWEAMFYVDGKPKYITGTDKADVISRWNKAKQARDNGTYVESTNMTLNQWIKRWLIVYKRPNVEPKTLESYYVMWKLYIKDSIGETKLQKLKGDAIQELINDMGDDGYSTSTINLMYSVLRGSIYKAWQLDIIAKLPTKAVELPKTKTAKDIAVLSVKDQETFEKHAVEHDFGDIFLLMLWTGLRPGEAMGLTRTSIDHKKKVIKVQGTAQTVLDFDKKMEPIKRTHRVKESAKSASGMRNVPMMPEVEELVKKLEAKSNNVSLICVDNLGDPLSPTRLRHALNRMTKAMGIPDIHPHTMRHTFATRQIEAGIDYKALQAILGHYNIAMTMDRYVHTTDDFKAEQMTKARANKMAPVTKLKPGKKAK